jgi:hypothetical protein
MVLDRSAGWRQGLPGATPSFAALDLVETMMVEVLLFDAKPGEVCGP